ncbi:MAG: O-antigen ligase family protein [Cyanobacteria bacterium HKST-UBA05]|nr:O-antigen ligase family protein [Cyanobacteria bacterium HKST-UBA05]
MDITPNRQQYSLLLPRSRQADDTIGGMSLQQLPFFIPGQFKLNKAWFRIEHWRFYLTLAILALYLLLDYAFMQVRFPLHGRISLPIGEILILLWITTLNFRSVCCKIRPKSLFWVLIAYFSYGVIRALVGFTEYGAYALRDATSIFEQFFILVGFCMVCKVERYKTLGKWLPLILTLGVLIGLSYPFKAHFVGLSPTIQTASGYDVPFFFTYAYTFVMMLMYLIYILLFKPYHRVRWVLLLAGLLIFLVANFQIRTIYIQLIALILFLSLFNRHIFKYALIIGFIGVAALGLIELSGFEIQGRFQSFSLTFFIKHFMSIFGIQAEGVEGATGGILLRLSWWQAIWSQLTSSVTTFLFGLGYGVPLTDFIYTTGVLVREPHNSYVSVLARLGVTGVVFYLALHIQLIAMWFKALKLAHIKHWATGKKSLFMMMAFLIVVYIYGMTEDAFEKPYVSIPFYTVWGIILRMYVHLLRDRLPGALDNPQEETANVAVSPPTR